MTIPFQGQDGKGASGDELNQYLEKLQAIAQSFLGELEDLNQIAQRIETAAVEIGKAQSAAVTAITKAKAEALVEIYDAAQRATAAAAKARASEGYSSSDQRIR